MASDREYERALAAAEGEVHVDIAPSADGDLAATVSWGDWISDGITRHGDSEGPMTVAQALRRAQEVADLYGFEKVAVAIPSDDLWNREWGVLKPQLRPQILEDEDDLDVADDGDEGPSPTTGWTDDDQRGGKRL
jgi:hypothetical protein